MCLSVLTTHGAARAVLQQKVDSRECNVRLPAPGRLHAALCTLSVRCCPVRCCPVLSNDVQAALQKGGLIPHPSASGGESNASRDSGSPPPVTGLGSDIGGGARREWEDPTLSNWKPPRGGEDERRGRQRQQQGQGAVYETKWAMMSLPASGPASGEPP